MSLHTASKYLASKGRRGDTELVHMTKDEIKGLQELALAHGGSLTINPETGLVEAGILKTILPMVGGAALMMIPGMQGFGGALAASAIMGGGMYAATGSVKEGLLAGLGAFGGANLASGLAAAGAEAASAEALAAAAPEAGAAVIPEAATSTIPSAVTATAPEVATSVAPDLIGTTATGASKEALMQQAGQELAQIQNVPLAQQGPEGLARAQAIMKEAYTAPGGTSFGTQFGQNIQNVGKGLPQIGNVIMEAPMKTALPLAVSGFAGSSDSGVQGFPPDQDTSSGSGMTMSPDFQGYTPPAPNPYYRAQYQNYRKKGVGGVGALAEGGIAGLAAGGMDPMNPVQNPIYPQSQQEHTNFASSTQYPNSIKSAMAVDYDTRTNPMTGQELPMGLAAGGVIAMASGTPKTLPRSPGMPDGGVYRDTDPDTATKDAYNAALIKLGKVNKAAGLKGLTMPKANMEKLGGSFDSVEDKASGGIARYEGGGAAAGGDSGVSAGLGGSLAAGLLASAGLPGATSMPSGADLSALGASNPQMMASLAALNPFYSGAPQAAPQAYVNPYADRQIRMPQTTTNYQFDTPIATAESIAKAEAARKAAEEEAARQAAQNSGYDWGGNPSVSMATGGIAHYNLGGYSDGGRMLKGPGDGMSDSIPASIGGKQAARLADSEFVVPADVVSHLGNGSSDAGAKKLYQMMDKVRHARTGKKKQAPAIKADKYLPKV